MNEPQSREPVPHPKPPPEPQPPSRVRGLQGRLALPDSARGRLRAPSERLSQTAGSAANVTRGGVEQLRTRANHVRHRVRQRMNRNGSVTSARASDGTPQRPLVPVTVRSRQSDLVARVMAPLLQLRDALRNHWQDTIREAKLAAREKETELRADYERRVNHDPRLHVEQLKPGDRDQ